MWDIVIEENTGRCVQHTENTLSQLIIWLTTEIEAGRLNITNLSIYRQQ